MKLAGRNDYSELQKPTERKRASALDIICECKTLKATEIANILETVNSLKQFGH